MDRPLAPWEIELQAEALAELSGSEPSLNEREAPDSAAVTGAESLHPLTDADALKRAERQLLIQQAERMIAEGRGDSSQLAALQNSTPAAVPSNLLLPLIRQHSLAIGVGVLLLTFVVLLLVMMNFVGRMASGISVPTP